MSQRFRYGIIGTGRRHGSEGSTGFGMAHAHIHGFLEQPEVEAAAFADINEGALNAFADEYAPAAARYADYVEMLHREKLDIVSICTWPDLHADMVVEAARAGVPVIYCEKPMATTWGDARRMKAAADAAGSTLIFNHQRRYLQPFSVIKELIDSDTVGDVTRIEATCGDLFDWGTHWIDMCFYFNNECEADWVLAQIDIRTEKTTFGVRSDDQAICQIQWKNGVTGLVMTSPDPYELPALRVIGTEGLIELGWKTPLLRVRGRGDAAWRVVDLQEDAHSMVAIDRSCRDAVRVLSEPGFVHPLVADKALRATEIIYAAYESSRYRGRIDLPLCIEDSPLRAMLDQRLIGPGRER